MNANIKYETRGTEALACRIGREREHNLIDYDIARRSYEARQRLAQRQQRAQNPVRSAQNPRQVTRKRNLSLVDAVESTYTPNRSVIDNIGDMLFQVKSTIQSHPFWTQLKNGSLAGHDSGRLTYREVFNTTSACFALSALMVFLGM